MNYYVYYKVPPDQVAALKPRVQALFNAVEKQFGVRGRWMHRRDDPTTYMEVYEGVTEEAAFEALLERGASKMGLTRKIERFECA